MKIIYITTALLWSAILFSNNSYITRSSVVVVMATPTDDCLYNCSANYPFPTDRPSPCCNCCNNTSQFCHEIPELSGCCEKAQSFCGCISWRAFCAGFVYNNTSVPNFNTFGTCYDPNDPTTATCYYEPAPNMWVLCPANYSVCTSYSYFSCCPPDHVCNSTSYSDPLPICIPRSSITTTTTDDSTTTTSIDDTTTTSDTDTTTTSDDDTTTTTDDSSTDDFTSSMESDDSSSSSSNEESLTSSDDSSETDLCLQRCGNTYPFPPQRPSPCCNCCNNETQYCHEIPELSVCCHNSTELFCGCESWRAFCSGGIFNSTQSVNAFGTCYDPSDPSTATCAYDPNPNLWILCPKDYTPCQSFSYFSCCSPGERCNSTISSIVPQCVS